LVYLFEKSYYLAVFAQKGCAAMAYDRAAVGLDGEYAGLNFPERKYRAKDPSLAARGACKGDLFNPFADFQALTNFKRLQLRKTGYA
jgi:hypothetical protein